MTLIVYIGSYFNNKTILFRIFILVSNSLIKLKLSHGDLQSVEANSLDEFGSQIQELDLAHNKLSQIPNGFLSELSNLEILDLSGNQFVTLGKI